MKKNSQRLRILSDSEIATLYAIPDFNETERAHYFSLPESIIRQLKIGRVNRRSTSTRLWFILQYGYFKARHQFFSFSYADVTDDVNFIMRHYMPDDPTPSSLPTRKAQVQTKKQILQYIDFDDGRERTDRLVMEKALKLAMITHSPAEIFHETMNALETERLVLPPYSRMQDLVGRAIWNERRRLIKMTHKHLTMDLRHLLNGMLREEESLHDITEIRLDAKTFQANQMKQEISKLQFCEPVYRFAVVFLPKLGLSSRMIGHYADLAKLYDVQGLSRHQRELAFIYMICYIHGRYEKLATNLVQAFTYFVDKYHNDARKYAKNGLSMLVDPLEANRKSVGRLMQVFTDSDVMRQSGSKIVQHAFGIMPLERIVDVSEHLLHGEMSRKRKTLQLTWEYYRTNSQSILVNLRPLFMAIEFESDGLKHLFDAMRFLKKLFISGETIKNMAVDTVPTAHIIPKSLLAHFTEKNDGNTRKSRQVKSINPWQYEFHLYRAIREHLKGSKIYVNSSSRHKSFESEIKIPLDWHENKGKILADINNPVLLRPIDDTLNDLKNILEPLIERVNRRAMNGENPHIRIKYHRDGSREWTVPYPRQNRKKINNPFYDRLEIRPISEAFDFVEQQCHFMRALVNIKPYNSKARPDYTADKSVILANGTLQGINDFAKRSNIPYHRLSESEHNRIRIATLRDAASIIISNMTKLPIACLHDLGGKKHGSSDGTKKKTRHRTLKARHSPKYFGSEVGIVIMSMLLGHVPFATEIIGANEHESHYIFSMLYNNESVVDPDIISTDSAGGNNVNDFFYYLIGKVHAPCYRSIPRKANTLCGFKPLSDYNEMLIKPSDQVNITLIKEKWPELVPVLASSLRHDVTQENVIRILSSHEHKSEVKDALWELNRILKSIHILRDIDDPEYRRNIRTALNRGERYNGLLGEIQSVGGGDFRGKSEIEIEVWNECTRLVALIIIYYNMHLLNRLYEDALARNDQAAIEFLRRISPVASQHINIGGVYEIREAMGDINVDDIVELMGRILEDSIMTLEQKTHAV